MPSDYTANNRFPIKTSLRPLAIRLLYADNQRMQRTLLPELLDDQAVDQAELNVNLADIARLNRLSGTTATLCRAVWELAAGSDTT